MKISYTSFALPKRDEPEESCQDSVSATLDNGGTFAVADGVTESFQPRRWARCLTSQFQTRPNEAFDLWGEWLKTCQGLWFKEVEAVANSPTASDYTVNKFHEGRSAASTFVGLRLQPASSQGAIPWRALVVGDSCLFHLQAKGVVSYLIETSQEFDNNTTAIASYPVIRPDFPHLIQGEAQAGDVFILATDAFSKWLLAQQEKSTPIWGSLLQRDQRGQRDAGPSKTAFERLVANGRRGAGPCKLDDDDVAVVVIRLGVPHALYAEQLLPGGRAPALKGRKKKRGGRSIQTNLILLALVFIINLGFYLVCLRPAELESPANPDPIDSDNH